MGLIDTPSGWGDTQGGHNSVGGSKTQSDETERSWCKAAPQAAPIYNATIFKMAANERQMALTNIK